MRRGTFLSPGKPIPEKRSTAVVSVYTRGRGAALRPCPAQQPPGQGRGGGPGRAPSPLPGILTCYPSCAEGLPLRSRPRWQRTPHHTIPNIPRVHGQPWAAAGNTGHCAPLQERGRHHTETPQGPREYMGKSQAPTMSSAQQTASSWHSSGERAVAGSRPHHRKPRTKQTEELPWPDNRTPEQLGTAPQELCSGGCCVLPGSLHPSHPCLGSQGLEPPLPSSPPTAPLSAWLRDRSSANTLLENRPWPR